MNTEKLLTILNSYNIHTHEAYASAAFARNLGLISKTEQEKLSKSKIAIAGLGGVGGVHLATLARLGFASFSLADFDRFEPGNINRQYGARVSDFGNPKIEVMANEALSINPFIELKLFPDGVTQENMEVFLEGSSVLLDGLDYFQFDLRSKLFSLAQKMNIPVVSAGPFGFSSAMLIFVPHGMSFDRYLNINEEMQAEEKMIHFQVGYTPKLSFLSYMDLTKVDQKNHRGPSCVIATQLASSFVATEVVRIVLSKGKVKAVPNYQQFDPYLRKYHVGYMPFGNRNPLQRFKIAFGRRKLNAAKRRMELDLA